MKKGLPLLIFIVAVLLPLACSSDPAAREYEKAEGLLAKGDYIEAMRKYAYIANTFQSSPSAPKSRYKIAFIHLNHLRDMKQAVEAYNTLLFLYPKGAEAADARRDLARIYSDAGEHSKAMAQYQWLNKQGYLDDIRFKYILAKEYMRMNDFRQARIEFEGLLKSSGDRDFIIELSFQLANTYFVEGDLKRAIEEYDRLLSKYPDHRISVEVKFNKAKALEESGRLAEALSLFKGLKPDYPNKDAVDASIKWIEDRLREGSS